MPVLFFIAGGCVGQCPARRAPWDAGPPPGCWSYAWFTLVPLENSAAGTEVSRSRYPGLQSIKKFFH